MSFNYCCDSNNSYILHYTNIFSIRCLTYLSRKKAINKFPTKVQLPTAFKR